VPKIPIFAPLTAGLAAAVICLPLVVSASTPSFTARAQVSSASFAPRQTASITASVWSLSAAQASVDIEIYTPDGSRVFEQSYDDQAFAANSTTQFSLSWDVPDGAESGDYSIQIGVFSPDWSSQYIWNATAGQLKVGTANAVPTATPTSSPRAKPTSLPTNAPTAAPTSSPTHAPTVPPTVPPTMPPGNTGGGGSLSGLHVAGNQILSGTGRPVQLRGVNRSSGEYACISGGGYGIFEGPVDQASVAVMQSWKINAVRVVLNEDCWLGQKGVNAAYSGTRYQDEVARYVNLLTSNNIAAIVNLHFNAPASALATGQQAMADRDSSPAFWGSVAARFKNNSAVLFEPYNEPYPDGGQNTTAAWSCWRDGGTCAGVAFTAAGMQELVTAIRNAGAPNVIIVTGNNYGSQLDRWVEYKPVDPLNQLAAGWHSYGDGLDCQAEACWNTVLASLLGQFPIVATEIGQFDCQHGYVDRVMNFLDGYGQGYVAWTWAPHDCAADPALLKDWSGAPTGYGQGLRDHFLSRASNEAPQR